MLWYGIWNVFNGRIRKRIMEPGAGLHWIRVFVPINILTAFLYGSQSMFLQGMRHVVSNSICLSQQRGEYENVNHHVLKERNNNDFHHVRSLTLHCTFLLRSSRKIVSIVLPPYLFYLRPLCEINPQ